jgi:hypothetical protein
MPDLIPPALDYEFLSTLDILADPTLMLVELQAGSRRVTVVIRTRPRSILTAHSAASGIRRSRAPWALTPGALGEDQPHAYLPERKVRQAVADEVGAPLPVVHAVLIQLGPDLDHDSEAAGVERGSVPEPDLDIPRSRRSGPGILRTVHRFSDDIGQNRGKTMKNFLVHSRVVRHINQRHGAPA